MRLMIFQSKNLVIHWRLEVMIIDAMILVQTQCDITMCSSLQQCVYNSYLKQIYMISNIC